MGVLDKFLTFMKVNDEEEEEFYDDDYVDEEEPAPRKPSPASSKARNMNDYEEEREEAPVRKPFGSSGKITSIKSASRKLMASGLEVCAIKPDSVEDAKEIAETLLNNHTVLLNLEGLEMGIAQRISDIIVGVSYAISGNLQRVSKYIYIVTPSNVNLSGDFQQEIFDGASEIPFQK